MKQQDIDDLRQLVDFLKSQQVAEFDLDRGDLKLRLKFHEPHPAPTQLSDVTRMLGAAQAAGVQVPQAAAVQTPGAAVADPEAGLHTVKSPMVGTFFSSPSPGSAAFVGAGDRVKKGQVICIVEAMKLMNEIESDQGGEIVRCLVTNGQAVEYGQPLFVIRPE
jgi:acetyl-CoA carboxylase biotin carboxyl carrier protein